MSFSRRILVGLAAGIALGLFLGDRASFLGLPAEAFLQLLQVTVLPYLVTSLVAGVGGATREQARRLATQGGLVLMILWALSLALVFASALALPPEKGGSFYATSDVAAEPRIDWLDLYIPSNPFRALANNLVPAVVLFSILLGVAILELPQKERILGPLRVVNETLGRAGSLVVRLTPYGLFAIAGHATGSMRLDELERLQAFLLIYVGLALLLTFALLPALVSTLTGLSYRRIVSVSLDPIVTAFVTANVFVVLPLLAERSKALLDEAGLARREAEEATDVLVPTSFTFPHSAKLLSLAFLPFAGWYIGAPVAVTQLPMLAGAGLLSFFGSLNAAIPFLLNLARLPVDLTQLFLISSVVNSRFGSAGAAMHTLVFALLTAHLMAGRVRFSGRRILAFALGTFAAVGLFLVGTRLLLARTLPERETGSATFDRLRLRGAWGQLAPMVTDAERVNLAPQRGARLDEIRKRGYLRVGVTEDEIPWSFRNGRGEAFGFAADLAHALAVELGVKLELVPTPLAERVGALNGGACDVALGRIKTSEAQHILFSRPFVQERWAFLVPDHARETFASLDTVRPLSLRVAVMRVPEWMLRVKSLLPRAEVIAVDSIRDFVTAPPGRFDVMYTGYERATAYSLLHPQFSAVVPSPGLGATPLAYAVPAHEEPLLALVNAWIEQARANGLIEAKLEYWVHGQGTRAELGPRWSIASDVLGWWR